MRAWATWGIGIVVAMGLATEAAAADPSCPYGVNAHLAGAEALDLAADAGLSWVRMDMNWFQTEPEPDVYNWEAADAFIEHATDAGLSVFVTLAYTPQWAASVPCNDADPNEANWCINAPADVEAWTDFVTAAVSRYADDVQHYGLWNEPNLLHFYRGTRPQWVDEVLVPGSEAVHDACGECFVLGPELANLSSANWDADEGDCFLGECTHNGWNHSLIEILDDAGDSIDIVTHHKYEGSADEFWQEATDGEFVVIQLKHGVKEVTDMYAPGKPVWITEFGWESEPWGPHSNDAAADELTALFEGFVQVRAGTYPGVDNQPWPELEKLFWYDLHDDPNGHSWGLLTADLQTKAPYDAYQAVIGALGCDFDDDGGSTGTGGAETSGGTGTESGEVGEGSDAGPGGEDGATVAADTSSGGAAVDDDGAGTSAATSPADPPGTAPPGTSGCACRSAPAGGGGLGFAFVILCGIAATGGRRGRPRGGRWTSRPRRGNRRYRHRTRQRDFRGRPE